MKKYSKRGIEDRRRKRDGYGEFFEKHIGIAKNTYCQNCGRRLIGSVSEIAHILPKNVFRSVATNDDNVLYLCSNVRFGSHGCHDLYDSSWERAKGMEIWGLAVERFNKFKHLVTERNRKILSHFYGNT